MHCVDHPAPWSKVSGADNNRPFLTASCLKGMEQIGVTLSQSKLPIAHNSSATVAFRRIINCATGLLKNRKFQFPTENIKGLDLFKGAHPGTGADKIAEKGHISLKLFIKQALKGIIRLSINNSMG
jgi:hypothetical protein